MTKYTYITDFVTGLRRDYITISKRNESEYMALPGLEQLKGIRGNIRKALTKFNTAGCSHYTIQDLQVANSSLYSFTIYRGYKEVNNEQSKT